MKIQELRAFSGKILKTDRKTAWCMACSVPAVWLIMKLIPDSMAGMLIFRKQALPADVFFYRDNFWILFTLLWNMLTFCILTPMLCAVCGWFSEKAGFGKRKYHFSYGRFYWKSLWFFAKIQCIRFLILLPFVLACYLTVRAFGKAVFMEEAGFWLFLTIQCLVSAFWAGLYYLKFCISLCAVPFLFLENPDISAFRAVRLSENMLSGRYGKLFLIFGTGLTVPKTAAMLILFLQIRIREYLQEYQIAKGETT